MSKLRSRIFEFPENGIISVRSFEQYATYSNMSVEQWMADAIAWYIDFHESQRDTILQDSSPIAPTKIPKWTKCKLWLAERIQNAADRCLDKDE